jgi:hypothetical protein
MDENRWAARVLGEVGSARAAITASYRALWRSADDVPPAESSESAAPGAEAEAETGPRPPTAHSCDTEKR